MVDTTRLDDSFGAVDYFEGGGIPFVVAVNAFEGKLHHRLEDVRAALAIGPEVPMSSPMPEIPTPRRPRCSNWCNTR